jgi:hypothetical protein
MKIKTLTLGILAMLAASLANADQRYFIGSGLVQICVLDQDACLAGTSPEAKSALAEARLSAQKQCYNARFKTCTETSAPAYTVQDDFAHEAGCATAYCSVTVGWLGQD